MSEKYARKVKRAMIEEMKDTFTTNRGFLISSQTDLSATDIDDLRFSLRKSGSRYFVLRNRLARIALNEVDMSSVGQIVETKQTLGISVIDEDPVTIAKTLKDFATKNKGFEVFAGFLEGRVLSDEKIKELADLPSREVLLGKLVGTMNAPVTNLVLLMSTMLRSFLYVLNGLKEKKTENQSK